MILLLQVVALERDNRVKMHKTHAHLPLIAEIEISLRLCHDAARIISIAVRNYRRRLRAIRDLDI